MKSNFFTFNVCQEVELPLVIQKIQTSFPNISIFLFEGDLGAGKTTFIKYFIQSFGVKQEVQSPTFSIANLYEIEGLKILHADLYRLKDENELIETGIPDLLAIVDFAFIEWYERILPWIEKNAIIINIQVMENEKRRLTCSIYNP